jgi:tetratricopeptide (TPR) repeat protein
MTLRRLSGIAFGAMAMAFASQAQAAVTVLGNGLAHSCFEFAEFGGNARDGITTCSMAIEQSALDAKDRAATYINRGILKSRNGSADDALEDYNHGLTIDADLGEGYVDRGAVMIVLRRYDDALADLNKGIALGANRLQIAYYDRAIVQEALGNIRGAYEDYKKAAEIQPDFTLATEQLARFKVVRKPADGT